MSAPPSNAAEPWYVAAFRASYRQVYPHRDLESARREIAFLVERGLGGRVLDLCCGFGRHTLAMRERGLDVAGFDLSLDLLVSARELTGAEKIAGRLVRADARAAPFADATFDGLVNLFSSFGYFGDDGDARVLDEVARVVRLGGLAVLDLMNPARIRAQLVPHSRTERDGIQIIERRALVDGGRRVVKDVDLTLADGSRHGWREEVRMYDLDEITAGLERRGFALEDSAGDFDGSALGSDSPRQILFARRVGNA